MKIITINVPEIYLKLFAWLKAQGHIPSRSEGMREVISLGFKEFLANIGLIEKLTASTGETEYIDDEPEVYVRIPRMTIAELREEYPWIPDFRYINEDKEEA